LKKNVKIRISHFSTRDRRKPFYVYRVVITGMDIANQVIRKQNAADNLIDEKSGKWSAIRFKQYNI